MESKDRGYGFRARAKRRVPDDIIFIDEESPASVACDTPKQKKDQLSLVPNGLET